MSTDIQLLKVLETRDNYAKYRPHVKGYTLMEESEQFLDDMGKWYAENPKAERIAWTTFMVWVRVSLHPTWNAGQLSTWEMLATNLQKAPTPDVEAIVARFMDTDTAALLKVELDKVVDDGRPASAASAFDAMEDLLAKRKERQGPAGTADLLAPFDLDDVFRDLIRKDGIEWRLPELNMSVGPLAKSDLVIVAKRPEVGGTSFLCSEVTHMLQFLPKDGKVAFFNNEEAKKKVVGRLMMAGLNKTGMDLAADPEKAKADWKKFLGTRQIDVLHDTRLSIRQIERVLRRQHYDLIVFNVLWKLQGSKEESDIGKLEDMVLWARTIADVHAPVIGVWQADGDAEGMPFPSQNHLYKSKTAVQGEADVLIFIGKTADPAQEYSRFIGVVKNKLPGGPQTKPTLKHGRFTVTIDYGTGRYTSGLKGGKI
jgi:hypothetical protein